MDIDSFMLWAVQNGAWLFPLLYIITMTLFAYVQYTITHQFILACMSEGTWALVFIFLIYIPFRNELGLEISTLFGFILIAILCFTSPLYYLPRDEK